MKKKIVSMFITLALVVSALGECPMPITKEIFAAEETNTEASEKKLVPDEKSWEYTVNAYDDETVSITGFNDLEIYSLYDRENDEKEGVTYCLVIPTEIAGRRVSSIDLRVGFNTDRQVTSFELPSTLKYISSCAFLDMHDLTHITIPEGVTEIGYSAFSGCSNLSSVELPESLQEIGEEAFMSCWSLKNIVIPSSVSYIEDTAFSDCRGMESFTVQPNNKGGYYTEDGILYHKWIDYKEGEKKKLMSYPGAKKGICNLDANMDFSWTAFLNVKGLTAINVDSENPDYTSVDGVVYEKNMKVLYVCPAGKSGEYTIPEGVCSIQKPSFSNSALTAIYFPDSLGESYINSWGEEESGFIEGYPLFGCDALQTVKFGKNVTAEMLWDLLECDNPNLKNIIISEENPYLSAVDNVVYDKEVKELVYVPANVQGKLVLPDTVETSKKVGSENFWAWRAGGNGVTEVVLGTNYAVATKTYSEEGEEIYKYATGLPRFECLQSIEVSPSNQTLAAYDGLLYSKDLKTLYYCPAAKEGPVTIPEGTTTILGDVFSDCSARDLKEIVIPASVTDIQCEWDINYSKITIKCPAGSAAEEFAKKQGANIVIIPSGSSATQKPDTTPFPMLTDNAATQEPAATVSPTPVQTNTPVATKKPAATKYYPSYLPAIKKPKKVKLTKAKAVGKGKVKVVWKWSVEQEGYQLQYAMNRSFTKKKKTLNKHAVISDVTLKNLKKGKTYYFRVRAYNNDYHGGRKYSSWSNVKKVKVK